jgi:hypothetical protein
MARIHPGEAPASFVIQVQYIEIVNIQIQPTTIQWTTVQLYNYSNIFCVLKKNRKRAKHVLAPYTVHLTKFK